MKTALTVICLLSISTAIFASPPPSVTRASGPEGALLTLEVKKNVYIGNRTFDVELGLSNSAGVSELILEDTAGLNPPCRERLEKVVLSGKELTFKRKFKMADIKGDVCDKQKDIIAFDMVIVRFHDGKIEKLSPFIFGFSKELTRQVGTYYEHEIKPVKITANLTAEQAGTIIEYDTTLETKSEIYDIGYTASASDLRDFRGVIFDSGEEFLSDNSQELADFVNSRKDTFRVNRKQKVAIESWFCAPWPEACLFSTVRLKKNSFRVNGGFSAIHVRLIKKGDISTSSFAYKIFN